MVRQVLEALRKGDINISASPLGRQEACPAESSRNPALPERDYRDEDIMVPLGDSAIPAGPDDRIPEEIGFIKLSRDEALRIREIALSGMNEAEMAFHLRCSKWRRRHQAIARWHHRKTRIKAMRGPGIQPTPADPVTHRDMRPKRKRPAPRLAA